jgi:NAD(P)H-binding
VQERIIRSSKLEWVMVRPVILSDGPKTNAYRALVDPRDWTCGFISRADVADFLVKQIDDDAFLYKTPVLTSSLPTSRSEPMRPPRRRAWLRIFVVRCGLPSDPPVGGHSCNEEMIPRFHRAVSD